MLVLFTSVTSVAAVMPKVTALTAVKLVPVMTSRLPPTAGPVPGDTALTVGTA